MWVNHFMVKLPASRWASPLLFGLCVLSAGALSAAAPAQPAVNNQLNELQQLCNQSNRLCLTQTELLLQQTTAQSRLWYQLTLQQLDLLFRMQRDEQLLTLTSRLVMSGGQPDFFRARLAIYHAKLLHVRQDPAAERYYQQAKQILGNWQQSSHDPQGYIRLYNLELYFSNDLEFAYQQLLLMADKYANRQDPVMQYDLHNNLGHFADKLRDSTTALSHRQHALDWAKQSTFRDMLGQAHFNLARQYTKLGQWTAALPLFQQAYQYYQTAEDPIASQEALLFGAETLWQTGQHSAAVGQFQRVDRTRLPDYRLPAYQQISQLLQLSKSGGKSSGNGIG